MRLTAEVKLLIKGKETVAEGKKTTLMVESDTAEYYIIEHDPSLYGAELQKAVIKHFYPETDINDEFLDLDGIFGFPRFQKRSI